MVNDELSTQTKQFILGSEPPSSKIRCEKASAQVLDEVSKEKCVADELKGYMNPTECSQKTETGTFHSSTQGSKEKESTESYDEWAFTIQDSRFAKLEKQ